MGFKLRVADVEPAGREEQVVGFVRLFLALVDYDPRLVGVERLLDEKIGREELMGCEKCREGESMERTKY